MTNGAVEVITSVQRRRRWPRAEKERIVAAALAPGAVASEVARSAGIHTSQLFRWRQQLCGPTTASTGFSAVAIVPDGRVAPSNPTPSIEIELGGGTRMRIIGAVDPTIVSTLLAALAKIVRLR